MLRIGTENMPIWQNLNNEENLSKEGNKRYGRSDTERSDLQCK